MVDFSMTASNGYKITVNGKSFGYLHPSRGFFTDSTVIDEFLEVSPEDLHKIAEKSKEIKEKGYISF